ncbi:MAG: hypothetical protein HZA28_04905 [Candidatus Omnitrophica bacterium]|nr:hypothetical protein [Candidatus Omnitrophota bacterium]
MRLYQLNKTVLRLTRNPAEFLNGLCSNTLDRPQNAFVNVHGRIVATFEQCRVGDDEFMIVVERAFADGLMAHLEKYIRLSGVRVEKLDRHAYFDVEGGGEPPAGCFSITQKKGRLLVSEEMMPAEVSDAEFTLFRLRNNIPVQGADYRDEFLLNVGDDEFVSYTKGCFLGQEPISKVHNRSRPTWKLVVCSQDECPIDQRQKMTSLAIAPGTRRPMGFVFMPNASRD